LVDLFECMMMHGITNPKYINVFAVVIELNEKQFLFYLSRQIYHPP